MGTTPNYLQIERILINQQKYAATTPSSAGSALQSEVEQALTDFRAAIATTDKGYLTWRTTFNDVLKASKNLRGQYDAARTECLEWGLDGFPDEFDTYMDDGKTLANGEAMLAYLREVELDQEWVAARVQSLQQALNDTKALISTQEGALREYRNIVPVRTTGYENALRVAREFFATVKGELEFGTKDYIDLTPHAV